MAGKLVADTIEDGSANSTSMTDAVMGSARAWVNFNGTGTVAIRNSYNVTSITDNGTGQYSVNFTSALGIADYCALGWVGGSAGFVCRIYTTETLGVSSFVDIDVRDTANAVQDPEHACLAIFADPA